MKLAFLALGALLAHLAVVPAYAQSDPPDDVRANRKADARATARNHRVGEGNSIPDAKRKFSLDERRAARVQRKVAGAAEARMQHSAEGNPVPERMDKVAREERAAARAERKAESRRANKAGEIRSKGEASY